MIVSLKPGVQLTWTTTTKFQTNAIECHFLQGIDQANFGELNLLSRILSSGCQRYPHSEELSAALAAGYGADLQISNRPLGQWHDLMFRLTFVEPQAGGGNWQTCLALLHEVIFKSLLNTDQAATAFQVEKRALISELRDLQTDNGFQAFCQTKAAFFVEPSFASQLQSPSVGTLAEVAAVDLARMRQLYREILAQWPVRIMGLSALTLPEVQAQLTAALPFSARKTTAVTLPLVVPQQVRPLQRRELPIAGAQSRLCLAYMAPTPLVQQQRDNLLVLGQVLGGSEQSLLFQQVREEQGLVYDISAYFDFTLGWLLVDAGVAGSQLDQVASLVSAALQQVAAGATPATLVGLVQDNLIQRRRLVGDSPQRLLNRQLNRVLQPQSLRSDADFAAALRAITPATLAASVGQLNLQVVTKLIGQGEEEGDENDATE